MSVQSGDTGSDPAMAQGLALSITPDQAQMKDKTASTSATTIAAKESYEELTVCTQLCGNSMTRCLLMFK